MGMYVIGTPRRDLDARNGLVVLEEDGFIHKTRSATVCRNSSERPAAHRERILWIYNRGERELGRRDLKLNEGASEQIELGRFPL